MDIDKGVDPVDGVLGGGGAKGFAHLGFLKALDELSLKLSNVFGISIGSQVAALHTNGCSVGEMKEILQKEFNDELPREVFQTLTGKLKGADFKLGIVDLYEINRQFVKRHNLVPNERLKIVSYNLMSRKPVIFGGEDYPLEDALTASMAVPLVIQPVFRGNHVPNNVADILRGLISGSGAFEILFDGALKHPCSGRFSESSLAIVSKLGFVSRFPGKLISPFNMAFHGLELLANPLLKMIFPDSKDSIVIETGPKNIAALSLGQLSDGAVNKMIDTGYEVTAQRLAMEVLAGRL